VRQGISAGRRDALRLLAGAAAVATLGVTSAGCAPSPAPRTASSPRLRIALANSYIGNSWRIEMENLWKAALRMQPYASQVDGPIYNANNNLRDQSEQLSALISLGVDAICIDAASPTALNGMVEQATKRGILVVSFDNTITAPSAISVNTDQLAFGRQGAEYLATALGGKGNIIMVTGVPGTTVDTQRNQGAEEVWRRNPGIKVVNRFAGMWDSSIAQKNTAAVIASLPRIDGIWAQGGTDGVLKAFQAAGRPLPPTAGESENGFRKYLAGLPGYPKVRGLSLAQPPYLSVAALELARQVLRREAPRRNVVIPLPTVTDDTVKLGTTVFPSVPDNFFSGITDTNPDPVVTMCLDAALTGRPCGDRLTVRLPEDPR
jgi:ribose transport system substrate-binding protein